LGFFSNISVIRNGLCRSAPVFQGVAHIGMQFGGLDLNQTQSLLDSVNLGIKPVQATVHATDIFFHRGHANFDMVQVFFDVTHIRFNARQTTLDLLQHRND
jgi:hypothetical protein